MESHIKRIVIKIGSSSLQHPQTGQLDFIKLERLVRELCDLKNQGFDVCLVSSGAIAVGRKMLGITERPKELSVKQACAAVGQSSLMMTYQKLFGEYHQQCGQVLLTKNNFTDPLAKVNATNTFKELFALGVIPIVNENDTVSTYEIRFGDNDSLAAIVSAMVEADLLILLSDIDGLFTDNPKTNPDAKLVEVVETIDDELLHMASAEAGSDVGTGGMVTKLNAAKICTCSGADMIIANGADVGIIHRIIEGNYRGTLFKAAPSASFDLVAFVQEHMV